jgi:hypothetical protein
VLAIMMMLNFHLLCSSDNVYKTRLKAISTTTQGFCFQLHVWLRDSSRRQTEILSSPAQVENKDTRGPTFLNQNRQPWNLSTVASVVNKRDKAESDEAKDDQEDQVWCSSQKL